MKFIKNVSNHLSLVKVVPAFYMLFFALMTTIPAFTKGMFKLNYDGQFHLARFQSIYEALAHGQLPPLVNLIGLSQHGLAVNGMYPWLTGLIFVIPKFLTSNYLHALFLGFILLNLVTMASCYFLLKAIISKKWVRFLGVALYQFNAYHLSLMYSRVSLGEALAYAFLPIVLLGCLKIWKNAPFGWAYLGLGMGLIANTHVLSLLLAVIMLCLFEIVRAFKRELKLVELSALLKAGIAAILVAFYSLTNIFRLSAANSMINPSGPWLTIKPEALWTALLNNTINEDPLSFNMGPLPTALVLILTIMLFLNKRGHWRIWAGLAFTTFIMTFSWFPWQLVGSQIHFFSIQFMGRVLSFTSLFLTMAVASYFEEERFNHQILSYCTVALLLITGVSAVHTYHSTQTNDGYKIWANSAQIKESIFHSFLSSDYAPTISKTNRQSALVLSQGVTLQAKKQTYNKMQLRLTTKSERYYQLPLARYNGVHYQLVINGKKIKRLTEKSLTVFLKKGNNTLTLSSTAAGTDYLSLTVSVLAFLLTMGIIVRPKELSWFLKQKFAKK
ncbi:hypothetical protein KBX31_01340 [Liquorilactobacillus satsumensis]|uniref:hypothetical protein n=2 Tax=Liquorilactobacillus satsumensis TaxID=259059 RepID=UPI0021C2560B|nr:hypothetical protein [Liquorilactobacillus satsumensis]MCP9311941.1 hypothetical protein [Liquorilactobacillus satsumensis]MCP9328585.1 hypothetical protein [Liquorilactobacillus satsumensis]MCP9359074.1 hypothetical protein [Liquorilactobacillus satsumensis]